MDTTVRTYNFDEIIERRGTNCVKHDGMLRDFGSNDLQALWVADMDFRSPDFVMEAIKDRSAHEVLGYTFGGVSYWKAVSDWLSRRYAIEADPGSLHFVPGIVAGIAFAIQTFTQVGEGVMVMTPIYPPFLNLPKNSGRKLVITALKTVKGRFEIDWEDFEQKVRESKMLLLSNPHNPTGRVWSREELQKIAAICDKNKVIVISDEIHADLVLKGFQHTSFVTVSEAAKRCGVMFMAPSKTFNIAGLGSSVCYVGNETLRKRFYEQYLDVFEVANGNVYAFVAAEAAFRYGEDWLRQLMDYLDNNRVALENFVVKRMPKVVVMQTEASFLAWMYFGNYNLTHEEMRRRLIEEAKVALNDGTTFGGECYGNWFRLNFGCPRAKLTVALEKIATMLDHIK